MRDELSSPSSLAPVATMLQPAERLRVDAAGEGLYRAVHRESLDDILHDLRSNAVSAVLVSVTRCSDADVTQVGRMVREFPRVPAVALLTEVEPATPTTVLSLGRSGVRTLVDVRQASGWRQLREVLLTQRADDIDRLALGQLALDLVGAPEDCWRFFEALFRNNPRLGTVRQLALNLGVLPSTLMSRFFRARLPAPKRYLAFARLTQAARVFENPGLSIASVANHLEYSSPQSFGRHVRTMIGMTAVDFRQRYDGEGMLQRFREELVLPYLPVLRQFSPLSMGPQWRVREGRADAAAVKHGRRIGRSSASTRPARSHTHSGDDLAGPHQRPYR
ncbi:MAG TPA: helix-turn-helix domain-containing protein [Gemmatimonadaceae bacterium]|nr:helix-turn-helix domain-containing protein [Gemmatimonadaceae bacterium]